MCAELMESITHPPLQWLSTLLFQSCFFEDEKKTSIPFLHVRTFYRLYKCTSHAYTDTKRKLLPKTTICDQTRPDDDDDDECSNKDKHK